MAGLLIAIEREVGRGDRQSAAAATATAMLRQIVGQIQELCELFGLSALDQRCYLLDIAKDSMEDDSCCLIMGGKSEPLKIEVNAPNKKFRREKSHEKALFASSSTETMEQQIWKGLPADLFDPVISRLPVAAFFRLRLVCRKWNSLLTSNSFSQHCAELVRGHPWFYMIAYENVNAGAMYDPSLKKWHHVSIPFQASNTVALPVASASGLICFLDIDHRYFYVRNPLTHSFKELPPRSVRAWSRAAVGMSLIGKDARSGYKIVWLGSNGQHEIYDSVKDSWTRPSIVPSSIRLPLYLHYRSQTVSIGSTLYFMRSDPDGIVLYDVATGSWKQLIIPSPLHLRDRSLAECEGQVMLVGLLSKNSATCICVWELQKMTLLWKEVDRMPNIWCLEFYGKHVRMTCLGNHGLLMLSLRSKQVNHLVTYDVANREWCKVPDCMLPCGKKRQWIACGTAFHPCPTAVA